MLPPGNSFAKLSLQKEGLLCSSTKKHFPLSTDSHLEVSFCHRPWRGAAQLLLERISHVESKEPAASSCSTSKTCSSSPARPPAPVSPCLSLPHAYTRDTLPSPRACASACASVVPSAWRALPLSLHDALLTHPSSPLSVSLPPGSHPWIVCFLPLLVYPVASRTEPPHAFLLWF